MSAKLDQLQADARLLRQHPDVADVEIVDEKLVVTTFIGHEEFENYHSALAWLNGPLPYCNTGCCNPW